MYSLPSASQMREPRPRTMYGGSPPTDLNARTGEFTPPGITFDARAFNSFDLLRWRMNCEYTVTGRASRSDESQLPRQHLPPQSPYAALCRWQRTDCNARIASAQRRRPL